MVGKNENEWGKKRNTTSVVGTVPGLKSWASQCIKVKTLQHCQVKQLCYSPYYANDMQLGTQAACSRSSIEQSEHHSDYIAMPSINPVPNELARKMCRLLNSRT